MNILLTGSSSFVGRHLLSLLNKTPGQLWHLVREPKGFKNEIFWDFKSEMPLNLPRFDVIVHLAAKPYFGHDLDLEQYSINTISTGKLACLAKKSRAFLIFASAAIVHGDASLINRATPLKPQCNYAMTKILAEEIIRQWTEDFVSMRIGGIYGLDGPTHLGLNRSISEAFHRRIVPIIKGNGQAKRNYICVNDVAKWISTIIHERTTIDISEDKVLYIGGPEILTIKNYLTSVARILSDSQGPVMEDGPLTADCIIEATSAPFPLTMFDEYLHLLKQKRDKNV